MCTSFIPRVLHCLLCLVLLSSLTNLQLQFIQVKRKHTYELFKQNEIFQKESLWMGQQKSAMLHKVENSVLKIFCKEYDLRWLAETLLSLFTNLQPQFIQAKRKHTYELFKQNLIFQTESSWVGEPKSNASWSGKWGFKGFCKEYDLRWLAGTLL